MIFWLFSKLNIKMSYTYRNFAQGFMISWSFLAREPKKLKIAFLAKDPVFVLIGWKAIWIFCARTSDPFPCQLCLYFWRVGARKWVKCSTPESFHIPNLFFQKYRIWLQLHYFNILQIIRKHTQFLTYNLILIFAMKNITKYIFKTV